MTIEELLEKPYWIIDIPPKQVPKDSQGQYFAVEDFFLKEELSEIKKKTIEKLGDYAIGELRFLKNTYQNGISVV